MYIVLIGSFSCRNSGECCFEPFARIRPCEFSENRSIIAIDAIVGGVCLYNWDLDSGSNGANFSTCVTHLEKTLAWSA